MKKKFFETNEFKRLNKEWYSKLKASGFVDTESTSSIEADSVVKQEFAVDHKWVEYNQQCVLFLESGVLTEKLDLFIFELHCDGRSNREIARLMVGSEFKPLHASNIDRRLNRILEIAKIKPINFGSV